MLYLCNIAFRGVSKLLYHIIFYARVHKREDENSPTQTMTAYTLPISGANSRKCYHGFICWRRCNRILSWAFLLPELCVHHCPLLWFCGPFHLACPPRWNEKCWTVCTMERTLVADESPSMVEGFQLPSKIYFFIPFPFRYITLRQSRTSNPLLIFGIRQVHRYNIFHLLILHHVSKRCRRRSHEGASQRENACSHEEHIWKYKSHFRACVWKLPEERKIFIEYDENC